MPDPRPTDRQLYPRLLQAMQRKKEALLAYERAVTELHVADSELAQAWCAVYSPLGEQALHDH